MTYRITHQFDEKTTLAETATIDAAIQEAKRLSLADVEPRVVREGSRIRVRATRGRAAWTVPCKPCKGTGRVPADLSKMTYYTSSTDPCEKCFSLGVVEDNPCQ
jgi:DnaJ-class molecular chaperone